MPSVGGTKEKRLPVVDVPPALKRRAQRIAGRLAEAYPDLTCPLTFRTPWECLAATILSAQCTDKKVNEVTPALFAAFDGPEAFARATPVDVEAHIRSIGLFRSKARHLVGAARAVMDTFHGVVPDSMDALTTLPGAGRKTANCVLANAFGRPGVMVDTHCIRVARRLGLHAESDPTKIEWRLKALLPIKEWSAFSHRIILHGRQCCRARAPACARCPLRALCPSVHDLETPPQKRRTP